MKKHKTPKAATPKGTKKAKKPKAPNPPKAPKAPKEKKEAIDMPNVLQIIPDREHINRLHMEELETLFATILESERGLAREKEGFLHRFYEHCEGLRNISAAKRQLRGEPPLKPNPYWDNHPSRTWRTQISPDTKE